METQSTPSSRSARNEAAPASPRSSSSHQFTPRQKPGARPAAEPRRRYSGPPRPSRPAMRRSGPEGGRALGLVARGEGQERRDRGGAAQRPQGVRGLEAAPGVGMAEGRGQTRAASARARLGHRGQEPGAQQRVVAGPPQQLLRGRDEGGPVAIGRVARRARPVGENHLGRAVPPALPGFPGRA